jgi:hypothetical protein
MTVDWWPASLAHIPRENPWNENHVVVAELRSFGVGSHIGHRDTISVLIPISELNEVRSNLAGLNNEVSASGPHPCPSHDRDYEPKFWVGARGLPRPRYEPLVLSWSSHDQTVLLPDPGFLMTYGLVPRAAGNGTVYWDDMAGPFREVVTASAPSVWSFPSRTPACVSISRDYLQDYLTLRKMALVQIFWEKRFQPTDNAIDERLGAKEAVEIKFPDRLIGIRRHMGDRGTVIVQVWGALIIASPGALPISSNSLEDVGLVWPGFEGPITDECAMGMRPWDYVYVDDRVLGDYEGRPEFSVNPNSGSVGFGTEWSVSFSERVGRNLIRLEIKKLYEGVPPHVTRHWHRFAVDPPPLTSHPAKLRERNIAVRAKEVIYAVVALGETLAALARSLGVVDLEPEHFVGLRGGALDYHGWWSFPATGAVARHVPLDLAVDSFLDRCLGLNKLIVEGLSERALRKTLHGMGIPPKSIKGLATLKLFDCIVRMAQVAHATGLPLSTSAKEVWDRLSEHGTDPLQPIARLFALHDLRLLKAHKFDDQQKLVDQLERFGVASGETQSGYGSILDRIYDMLSVELADARVKVEGILV